MEGIERNLLTKNRDRYIIYVYILLFTSSTFLPKKVPNIYFVCNLSFLINFCRFTQNLSVFRRDINDSLKGPNVTTTTVNDMMTS